MYDLKLKKGFAIGMVHLPPAQDCVAGNYSLIHRFIERAKEDARILEQCGFDGIMVQNGKDVCQKQTSDRFTVSLLSAVCAEIRATVTVPLGISVLKNDVKTALTIAKVTGMQFVRCKVYVGAVLSAEGLVEGCAADAIRCRSELGCGQVELWSETYDLSSRPILDVSFGETLAWCAKMKADSFLVTGRTHTDTLDYCRFAKKTYGDRKVIIGGGVTLANMEESIAVCDGFVVGSAVEKQPFTGPVCPELAREFISRRDHLL